MKVLINGLQVGKNNSGVQYYTKHLYNAIKKLNPVNLEVQLYKQNTNPRFPSFLSPVSRLLTPSKIRLSRILNENLRLPKYLTRNSLDLYHSPNYVLPFFLKSPSLVTIHDLITLDYPKLCKWESVLYFKLALPRSIKKANKIVTVSEKTKTDIQTRFKIPNEKIVVTHLGISSIFRKTVDKEVLSYYSITDKYILFVGNIEPKKNLVRLLQAYNKLNLSKNLTHKLVISGRKGWKCKKVFSTVKKLKLQESVIFTGYVPENDLPVLYSMADLFVFPSIYEGFGIPPLEAMACEVPILTSNTGALPETTGGNCLLVNPYNVNEIADGIHKLLVNEKLRKYYIEKGRNWVKQFTWERTAKKTLQVYNQVKAEVKVKKNNEPASTSTSTLTSILNL
jgi:glycosyltransferase involved in cell wall biosynthesis